MSARILIVDDTPSSVKMLAAKLTNEYYEVLTADAGKAALKAVEEDAPDLVLLDVMMPGIDGFDVCQQIKQTSKPCKPWTAATYFNLPMKTGPT